MDPTAAAAAAAEGAEGEGPWLLVICRTGTAHCRSLHAQSKDFVSKCLSNSYAWQLKRAAALLKGE